MSLCKWSCICFLSGLIVIGWPATVCCESSLEEKHPPGVKECRVHIEKALEQYWDKKEPDEIPSDIGDTNENYLDENNLDDEKENIRNRQADANDRERQDYNNDNDDEDLSDEEDNNDDAETEDNEEDSQNRKELNADEDDDDEEEENGNEDEENILNEDEDEEDDENEDNDDIENDDEEGTEDEDEDNENEDAVDEIEDEDNENEVETNENEEADENEDEDIETEDEDNENEDKEEKSEDEDNNHDNNSSNENDEEPENSHNDEQDNDKIEHSKISATSVHDNEVDTDQKEDDKNDGNETNPKEESIETEESHTNSDGNKDVKSTDEVDDYDNDKSKNNNDGDIEENKAKSGFLDEPSTNEGARSDISPEKTDTGNDKATDEDEIGTEEDVSTEDDDSIENIYEEEEESEPHSFRSREHVDVILGIDEIGAGLEKEEEKMAQSVFRDIKKIETTHIKPVELLYKYADSTTRTLGDAEIFSKPMLLFLGPWGTGKTSIINYLLGQERTPSALKTGTGITDVDFTILTYGKQRRIISGTELAADWKYAGVQKFGQGFLDHFRSIHIPHPLLQKVTIVDSPGIVENRKNTERGYSINNAFQWFIDRADAVYVVLDPSKVDIGGELGSVIEQLQGQNVRFLLNKADSIRRSDLMRVVGQLFWNLSPLLGGAEAPLIYAVSLTSNPYHPSAPAKFLADQEKNFLYDMKSTLDKRVENKILYARKHAVRVRNHAKMVDCYLASYYRHKSIFSNKRNVAKLITENPRDYSIYDGLTSMTNVSRSDVPNPLAYKEFFKIHPLYDFKPLASTCSYFRGCPMDKVDLAITKELPELLAKYKDAKRALYGQLEQDR